ncbi:MAG: tetratricopeptide repeat protein, partial [Planctomycetota bacterium]
MLALLLLASPLFADRETAAFFLTRAETAMEAGNLDEAKKFIERSLSEETGYLPALVMSARLARLRGDDADAIRQLEAVLKQKDDARGSAEGRAIQEAEKLIGELDKGRGDYQKLLDEYVDRLLAIARDAEKKKPKLALACYRQILTVQPDHKEALRKAKAPAKAKKPAKTSAKVRGTPLFNGKNMNGWSGSLP